MNKSAERAEALARAEKLVREANSRKANLEGIADLLGNSHPEDIADGLLKVYFEAVYLMTSMPYYEDGYLAEHLYTLKEVYLAFAKAAKPSEVSISLTVTEEPESLR
ncbi:MAG: hypothetical protein V8Q44_05780 [Alistipes ihumii]